MKTALGIIAVLVLVLGVWLSWRIGRGMPQAPATTAPVATTTTQATSSTLDLASAYQNGTIGFAIKYPAGYTIDESYKYRYFAPRGDIPGVAFIIPASKALGTNLSNDTYLSVEEIEKGSVCTADQFVDLNRASKARDIAEGSVIYSFASTTDAAAGNRYEEWVYARQSSRGCIAVRYFIHYGVIENYPAGSVKEFDKQALLAEFNAIRGSLSVQ